MVLERSNRDTVRRRQEYVEVMRPRAHLGCESGDLDVRARRDLGVEASRDLLARSEHELRSGDLEPLAGGRRSQHVGIGRLPCASRVGSARRSSGTARACAASARVRGAAWLGGRAARAGERSAALAPPRA